MTLVLPETQLPDRVMAKLRILQTTDLHGHVLAYDYHRDTPSRAKGLSRTATLIARARQSAPLSLLFDSGDFLQGSPLSDRLAQQASITPRSLPMIDAMNLLQFDAVTLGNHDLDFGMPYLAEALGQARFPVVSANLTLPEPIQQHIKRFTLLQRREPTTGRTLKIGVTGCLPRETLQGAEASIQLDPIIPSLATAITEMKRLGADVIIVLAHCGFGSAKAHKTSETLEYIAALDGVDAILGGHTHDVYPDAFAESPASLSGSAVVMAGAWGSHLGQIDLVLKQEAQKWQVSASTATAIPVQARCEQANETPECPVIIRNISPAHEETRAEMSAHVGQTLGQIDSFFSLVRDDAGLQLIAAAFEGHMRALLGKTEWSNLPLLSAAAPYKTGARAGGGNYCLIPAGTIAKRDVSDLYGFSDRLCAIKLNGTDLRRWLEQSASVFNQITPGSKDLPLLNPAFPGYLFDVIPQLTYQINLCKPARFGTDKRLLDSNARRVENLCYNARPVRDGDEFIVALNSYRAHGAWPESLQDVPFQSAIVANSDQTCASILERHIAQSGPIPKGAQPSWSFAPIAGATALFLTAPEAQVQVQPQSRGNISYVQTTAEGFAQMRLNFDSDTSTA